MTRTIAAIAFASAMAIFASQGMAGGDTNMKADTPTTGEKAKGAPGDQPAGAETSDRTPQEATPTPETQVDKTKEGETSTRTPEKSTTVQPDAKGAPGDQPAGTETSDRTPETPTPTPETQVDKTKEGETSTRTPEKK